MHEATAAFPRWGMELLAPTVTSMAEAARWCDTGQMPGEALDHDRHFPVGPALDEFLEAAEFDDMQAHLMHFVLVVGEDGLLAVALDSRETGSMATRRSFSGWAAVSRL